MPIKKSELYSSLWKSCDELRGGMDASQYKDYVLVILFLKYVSDKYANDKHAVIEVPKGGSFTDIINLKGKKDIGEGINKIIAKLAEANDLKGVIDVTDFNDEDKLGKGEEMQDLLSNLVGIFENAELDFSKNRAEGDDILGDAYEYLMRNFATESGKSKGQFYTPAEVSRIMAKVIGINKSKSNGQTIYDPTCGSGSLLLKAADEADKSITLYGQENDNATAALAKMNMILHGNPTAEIWKDNTLAKPHFKDEKSGDLKTFDFAVANPPFSSKAWRNGFDPENDEFNRFEYGIPPNKNGDYAFLLHLIRSLKSKGKGAIILPHGVLFRGNVEGDIRQNLIRKGFIKGIIGLPPNLFYGTGIPACIVIIDKENAEARKGIFIIDASKGYMKDGNKNRLRHQDIHKIVDVFNSQTEILKYSRMVPFDEIEKNEYNLNIPRYIDSSEPEDIQDIEAHLLGDIPNRDIDDLSEYWQVFPSIKAFLFTDSIRAGYSKLKAPQSEIKKSIFEHPEFVKYTAEVNEVFNKWKKRNQAILKAVDAKVKPKEFISTFSEDILETFCNLKLIDKYDIYQHLMVYWTETMQDDMYLISDEGWKAEISKSKDKKGEWNCDLVPKHLVINRYFINEKKAIEKLETDKDALTQQKEEMEEEQSGDEGVLEELKNDKGKISKGAVLARIKAIQKESESADELTILQPYMKLIDDEAEAGRKIKEAEADLDKKLLAKYNHLSADEIKILVVDDKWITDIQTGVTTQLERISHRLTGRIKELAERYETPLPAISAEVDVLTDKVADHLKKMGFSWK